MRATKSTSFALLLALAITSGAMTGRLHASLIPISQGSGYVQNFDTLPSSGKSTFVLPGWSILQSENQDSQGNQDNQGNQGSGGTQILADDGSSALGGIHSYGLAGSPNRALGTLTDANGDYGIFGANFQNSGPNPINGLHISYTGEEWRLGVAGHQNTLEFQYSLNASSLSDPNATWLNVPALSFLTPNLTGTGAHDGTLAINQTQIASTISFLNVPQGATFWVRWQETGVASNTAGDGLAVDNFSITAVPEVSTLLGALAALGLLAAAVWHPRVRPKALLSRL